MNTFKEWYMDRYWEFDNLFLQGAEVFGVTYHEFVLLALVIIWPAITLSLVYAVFSLWRSNRRLLRTFSLSLTVLMMGLIITTDTKAGPSLEVMDYSIKRDATISTFVRGPYRFDVILPSNPNFDIHGGMNSSWYGDETLIVREIITGEIVYSRSLSSEHIRFIEYGLSENYAVMTEWSGGMSCCLMVYAFKVNEGFQLILKYNNLKFDATDL